MKKKTKIAIAALATVIMSHSIMYWKSPNYKNFSHMIKAIVSDTEALKEIPKVISDIAIEKGPEKKEGFYRVDFHAHMDKKESYGSIENWFNILTKNVEMVVLTNHFPKGKDQLSYEEIKQLVSNNKGKLNYNDMGKLFSIIDGEKELYIIKGQEVRTNEGFHVIVFGTENEISRLMNLEELINIAEKDGTAIISHPYSVPRHGLLNKEKEKILFGSYKKVSAIEEFNASNTLWLFVSNVKAKKFVEKYGIATVSGSDMHNDLKKVGRSCTYIKKSKINITNEKTFFASLEKAIKDGDNPHHKEYCSIVGLYKDLFNHP